MQLAALALAQVTIRQADPADAELGGADDHRATDAERPSSDDELPLSEGEIAELAIVAPSSSLDWALSIAIDGRPLLGCPISWAVHAGEPHATHSRIDAPWIGAGTAPAGREHGGILTLRDAMGNECDASATPVTVEVLLR